MNEELIADLKQLITATISQQLSGVVTKEDLAEMATKDDLAALRAEMATKDDIARLERKLDEVQGHIAEALDTSNNAVDAHLKHLDRRLGTLEQAAA
jgi:hypothetical protein